MRDACSVSVLSSVISFRYFFCAPNHLEKSFFSGSVSPPDQSFVREARLGWNVVVLHTHHVCLWYRVVRRLPMSTVQDAWSPCSRVATASKVEWCPPSPAPPQRTWLPYRAPPSRCVPIGLALQKHKGETRLQCFSTSRDSTTIWHAHHQHAEQPTEPDHARRGF